MKIQEFRDMLKKCNRDDVEKITSELYKMMPKRKKMKLIHGFLTLFLVRQQPPHLQPKAIR